MTPRIRPSGGFGRSPEDRLVLDLLADAVPLDDPRRGQFAAFCVFSFEEDMDIYSDHRFGPDGKPRRGWVEPLWRAHRDGILAAWVATRPGTRPTTWWRFDAPRHSRREVRDAFGHGTRIWGPPAGWSEARYLQAHDLLAPGEGERIRPKPVRRRR